VTGSRRDGPVRGTEVASSSGDMRIHRLRGFAAYSYLLETDDALYLVDAGTSAHAPAVLRAIEALGRKPEDIRLAVVTHAHADHYGGLGKLQERAEFPVACHPAHAEVLRTGGIIISPGLNPFSRIYASIARAYLPISRLPKVTCVVTPGNDEPLDAFGLRGRILHTPGHSDGCVSLLLDDGSAFVGDLVQGRRLPFLSPELPNMALDTETVLESWRALLDAGATTIYPAHGSVVTAEEVRPVLARIETRRQRRAGAVRA
jgi:hydroxyacylglutathione hydrolase